MAQNGDRQNRPPAGASGRKGDQARAERLRAALRENLKRRKAQARVRSQAADGGPAHDSAGFMPDKPDSQG